MSNPPKTPTRGRVDWQPLKTFTDPETGYCVEVRVLALGKPKYSISVGQAGKDGPSRFLNPGLRVENARVEVACDGMRLARILDEAKLFIKEHAQLAEDHHIAFKIEREQRQVDRAAGVDSVAKTGKTEREKGKRAQHEHNLAARRSADQDLRNKMRGK